MVGLTVSIRIVLNNTESLVLEGIASSVLILTIAVTLSGRCTTKTVDIITEVEDTH